MNHQHGATTGPYVGRPTSGGEVELFAPPDEEAEAAENYDRAGRRRAAAARGRAHAVTLRGAAAAGSDALPGSAWPERGREAIAACRVLAAFFGHHPTDPVAAAIAAELRAAGSVG